MAVTDPLPVDQASRDAHYHAIAATATWAAYVAGLNADLVDQAGERARERAERHRETSYERRSIGLPPL